MKLTESEKKYLHGKIVIKQIPFKYVASVGIETRNGSIVECHDHQEYIDYIKKNKLFQKDIKVKIIWNNDKIDKAIEPFFNDITL